jgi:hypothetical protein
MKRARKQDEKRSRVPPGEPPVPLSRPESPSGEARSPDEEAALLAARVLESTRHLRGLSPAEVQAIHENLAEKLGHDPQLVDLARRAGER